MSLIDNGLEQFGTTLTLKTVTVTETEDVYGTATHSYANTSILGMIGDPEENDRMLAAGILETGDMVATVKSTQAIKEGDLITYNSEDWEVVKVVVMTYKDETTHKRVGLKMRA